MPDTRTFGDWIREARVARDLSLRELARLLKIAPSYLSDIENGRRIPSEEVTRELSRVLELDFDELMAVAGRVGVDTERYLRRTPAAGALFRKISEGRLSDADLRRLDKTVEAMRSRRD
jgi:transcriptional regulator with XRE-family HTH domain